MSKIYKAAALFLAVVLCFSAAFLSSGRVLPTAFAEETGDETDPLPPDGPDDPAHEHAFGDWTYAGEGKHVRACACGETEEADCAFGTPAPVAEAPGRHAVTCSVCGGREEADCTYADEITLPTQTTGGFVTHTCTVCAYSYRDRETLPERDFADSRMLGDLDADGKFTAGEARSILRIALSLDGADEVTLAYSDLSGDGLLSAADARLALRFSVGLETEPVRHSYGTATTLAATCTATGELQLLCAYCGEKKTLITPAVPHTYGQPVITPATCTKTGLSVSKCVNCGAEKTEVLPAAGHKWTPATREHGELCSVCGRTRPGWTAVDGDWYYYNEDGTRLVGKHVIDDKIFRFAENGVSETGQKGVPPKIAVLGDSLVVSLQSANVATDYDFYGKVSLHVNTMDSKKASGSDRFILDEVIGRDYDRVVILVGINDLDYADSVWGEWYRDVIRGVKTRAPGAKVFAHAIFPVNDARAAGDGYGTTNAKVKNKNAVIARIAAEENVTYLDPVAVMTDASGQLPYDAASDGIHFGPTYARVWYDWVRDLLL